jgi:integrase/recombinase XerD
MSRDGPSPFGRCLMRFFTEYLPTLRGMSPNTIRSYRDALVLFLQFVAQDARRRIERLDLTDVTAARVATFLKHLETERGNSIATRNARLAALHTFARFLAAEHPEHLLLWQAILAIPFKRGARDAPIAYFETHELAAFFNSIERTSAAGQRDYVLFALMFNTGARVQEILNLRVSDLRIESPAQVKLHGKGNKVRVCPIWPATARLLRDLVKYRRSCEPHEPDPVLFINRRGTPLTRFGVRYLLRRYVAIAGLCEKRLHPHSLRHTTAIHLLKAGVDFATISYWLGHATLNTTMRYARADIDLKRQAIAQVFPTAITPPRRSGRLHIDGTDLTGWLRRL